MVSHLSVISLLYQVIFIIFVLRFESFSRLFFSFFLPTLEPQRVEGGGGGSYSTNENYHCHVSVYDLVGELVDFFFFGTGVFSHGIYSYSVLVYIQTWHDI